MCVCVCVCVCVYGEQFPTDPSACVLAVKAESHKGTLQSRARWMLADKDDSQYLGLGYIQKLAGLLCSV